MAFRSSSIRYIFPVISMCCCIFGPKAPTQPMAWPSRRICALWPDCKAGWSAATKLKSAFARVNPSKASTLPLISKKSTSPLCVPHCSGNWSPHSIEATLWICFNSLFLLLNISPDSNNRARLCWRWWLCFKVFKRPGHKLVRITDNSWEIGLARANKSSSGVPSKISICRSTKL